MAFPPASTCSGNAAYSASVITMNMNRQPESNWVWHWLAAMAKMQDASKPRLVIDAGIMKEIRDDLEGGFGFGQGHVGMSCYYYYTLGRVGARRRG